MKYVEVLTWTVVGIVVWLVYLHITRSNLKDVATSFDPRFQESSGTLSNVTYTGNFNRIAKMMFFCVNVQFSSLAALGTGQFQITLPAPARQTFTSRGGTLHTSNDSRYHIAGIVDTVTDSASVMKFYYSGSTTDLVWKFNTPANWTVGNTSATFDVSGFYEVQAGS